MERILSVVPDDDNITELVVPAVREEGMVMLAARIFPVRINKNVMDGKSRRQLFKFML